MPPVQAFDRYTEKENEEEKENDDEGNGKGIIAKPQVL